MKRLGVISTLVWDVIYRRPPYDAPVEGWGGATYSLSALDAALSDEWEIVPLIKTGRDRIPAANAFMATLQCVAPAAALIEVPESNNCSELRYVSDERRTEKLSGGVPAWTWDELREQLERLRPDALYVNFLSGWEIDLDTAKQLREWFDGPIYADIHMMVWKPMADGSRVLTPVPRTAEWLACFDVVQVNEDEVHMLSSMPEEFEASARAARASASLVTMGKAGVRYWVSAAPRHGLERMLQNPGSGSVGPDIVHEGPGADPTGCGDVWGATCFASLLGGSEFETALSTANRAASRNAAHSGVEGLAAFLKLRTGPEVR